MGGILNAMTTRAEVSTNVYCGHRPVHIAALLELYERNYNLVEQLVPELDLPFDTAVSRSTTDLPLHLTVQERSRYTCAFKLTYAFTDAQGTRLDPDLQLRVYRDAHVVEALRCAARPPWVEAARRAKSSGLRGAAERTATDGRAGGDNANPDFARDGENEARLHHDAERFLSAQWARNLLLYKWLNYLLHHGHGFGMAGRPRITAPA